MIITLLIFIGTLLALVGLHEGGHYLAAKATGVYVKEFAIGFGPRLLGIRGRETVYSIRAIPFGGYVRMAGEDRAESDPEIPPERILCNRPPSVRALISLAGPLVNLVAALVIIVIAMWATSQPILQVAGTLPGSPAAAALMPGDRILSIDGQTVYTLEQITSAIQASRGGEISFDLTRGGARLHVDVTPRYEPEDRAYKVGAYFLPLAYTNEVKSLSAGAPLAAGRLRPGDRILSVDGAPTETGVDVVVALEERLPALALTVTVRRNGQVLDLAVPTAERTVTELLDGVEFADMGSAGRQPGFVDGILLGADRFAGYIRMMGDVVRGLFGGRIAPSEAFQGPIGVARILGEGAGMGPSVFFQLLAFLSLNFGLLNLIPFPALDGSRVAFALYEAIRGRPIPPEREGMIHAIGFFILIGLMVLITYKDIARLFQ